MENNNNTPKKIFNIENKITPILLNPNQHSFTFNNELKSLNLQNYYKSYYKPKNKDFIISKNKFFPNNFNNMNNEFALSSENSRKDFSSQFPLKISKKDIMELLYRNKNPKNIIPKIEAGVQSDITEKRQIKSQKNNIKLLKKLIDNSKINNNLEDIDYILESPYRGVEKMGFSLSKTISQEKENNCYKPIYIGNNYKGYFCIKDIYKSKSRSVSMSNDISNKKSYKKINIDKYNEIKKDKKIDSPLKGLSKMSGVSCSKLRKVIDYSLSHRIKNFNSFMKKKLNNDNNRKIMNHCIIDSNNNSKCNNARNKCIYSMISLKSKQKKKLDYIKKDSLNFDNDISFENVIGNHFFQDKRYNKNYYIKKKYKNSPIYLIKDNNLFNNLTIKDKIEAFYK